MTLKVIGAGFGRTGTNSTHTALNQLGFPCYHMLEVLENKANKSHMDFWLKVADGKAGEQHPWGQVFSKYSATVDNPACCVWRELMVAYPDAKVLLTLHPAGPDAWYKSTMQTIYFTENTWQFKVLAFIAPPARKLGELSHKLIWGRSHRGSMRDRATAIARYNEHIAEVKAAVPADKLLVFSAKQGWQPLCDFLGVPIPNTPFPNVNDSAEFQQRIIKMKAAAYAVLAIGVLASAGIVYETMQLLN
jgi:hypothetical protein